MSTSKLFVYKVFRVCTLLIGFVFLTTQAAYAAQARIALVIGNADYPSRTVATLQNPVNDARDMHRALKKLGFKVYRLENAEEWKMEKAFRFFGQQLKAADPKNNDVVALFYYSGHGAQVNGKNYLLAVDKDSNYDVKESKVNKGIVLMTKLFHEINAVGDTTNIFILDACRNNPASKDVSSTEPSKRISALKGIYRMEEKLEIGNARGDGSDPDNSIFAYATARDKVAEDGEYGVNSPYTQYLLSLIAKKGLSAYDLFQQVGNLVKQAPNTEQEPWQYSSMKRDFYFNGTQEMYPTF